MSRIINPIKPHVDPHTVGEGIPWGAFRDFYFVAAFGITALMIFINTADFQGADADSFSVKYQIYLRLLACAMAGLYGVYFLASASSRYLQLPGILIVVYAALTLFTSPNAIDVKYAFVASICMWCGILFIPAAIDKLGNRMFLTAVALGTVLYVGVSWFLYIFVPEIGVAKEFISDEEFLERMGGLGHPNNLGVYATGSFLLMGVLWRMKVVKLRTVILWAIVWAATIYACLSRTSILLAMIGWFGIVFDLIWRKKYSGWIGMLAMGLLVAVMALVATGEAGDFIDKGFQSLSKSGDSSELSSATGRSEIWAYGYKQFLSRPFIGYGYGSSRFVMADHSFHCHNIVINGLLQNGIIAGLMIFMLILYLARQYVYNSDFFMRAFIPCFVVGGLVESLIYTPAPAIEMIIFFSLILWDTSKNTPSEAEPLASD